jgi:hypothetical protein
MWAWAGKLFGTDKAVDNLLDKDKGLLVRAGGWLDGLSHTSQEKAADDQLTREWGVRQLEALAPFKVMQRIMVTIIMIEWAILFNNIVIAIWAGSDSTLEKLMAFAMSEFAWMPVLAAVTLYLLGGVVPRRGQS